MLIKNSFKLSLLSVSIIALLFSSCRDQIQGDFPDTVRDPVLNCFLVGDSLVQVHISMSGKIDTLPLTVVDNATVTCIINDSVTEVLKSTGNGYYTGKTIAKAGKEYRFVVSIPGYPEITALDTVPLICKLQSVKHINIAGIDEEGNSYPAVRITFPVDPDTIHYYQIVVKYFNYDHWQLAQYKDFRDQILLSEGLPIPVFNTADIQDTIYCMNLDYTTGHVTTINGIPHTVLFPFVVEFKTISYQYYQYLRQLYLYNYGRYPDFQFGPYKAFPLYSNVTNGLGIVAGYSKYVSELITPED